MGRGIAYKISNGIVVVLLGVLLIIALSQLFGVRYFSVLSGSMSPDIPVGSLVVAVPEKDGSSYKKGDVVSYVADENLMVVTHRVVEVDNQTRTITTQGDANETTDPPVLMANVVGKVAFSIPGLGYPLMYLTTLTGKIVAVTIVVVLLLSLALLNLLKPKTTSKRLVITYDNPEDLDSSTFAAIVEELKADREVNPRNA